MMTWWFLTFMAPAIKAKVHQLPGVEHLYAAITKDQLEIPAYITEYDMAVSLQVLTFHWFDFKTYFFLSVLTDKWSPLLPTNNTNHSGHLSQLLF